MARCGRPGFVERMLRRLGLRARREPVCGDWFEEPPAAGVREPRRPRPGAPGSVVMLEPPG